MSHSRRPTTNAPTFAMLREKRRLAVYAPLTGARFTISLRDWEELIWSVRVYPEPKWRHHVTPHTTAHRMMALWEIENWLEGLRLTKGRRCGSSARSSPLAWRR